MHTCVPHPGLIVISNYFPFVPTPCRVHYCTTGRRMGRRGVGFGKGPGIGRDRGRVGGPTLETFVASVAADPVRAGSRGEDVSFPGDTEGCDPPQMSDAELHGLLRNLRLRAQLQRLFAKDTPASVATTGGEPSAAALLPTMGARGCRRVIRIGSWKTSRAATGRGGPRRCGRMISWIMRVETTREVGFRQLRWQGRQERSRILRGWRRRVRSELEFTRCNCMG